MSNAKANLMYIIMVYLQIMTHSGIRATIKQKFKTNTSNICRGTQDKGKKERYVQYVGIQLLQATTNSTEKATKANNFEYILSR